MILNDIFMTINHAIWGWPLLIFVVGVSIVATVSLNFVQITQFVKAWKLMLFPSEGAAIGDMTPFEALVNALSTSIGNGSIAGIATAIYQGGPGAAFWIFVFGILSMSIRYAEVFLSTFFKPLTEAGNTIGGPMIYLQRVPGGKVLSYFFAFFLLFLGLSSGNAMQANSIRIGFGRILNTEPLVVAIFLLLFIAYVMAGGAKRIVQVSEKIVPIKVGLFFISALIVLIYHAPSLLHAIKLIFIGAFYPKALAGGVSGFLVQHALRYGIVRSVNATEAGLGTAAVLFGGTGATDPKNNGIMSMVSVFISANLVCFMVALMIIVSGVWDNGQTSLDLTISAYETVFGAFGGWVVTLLSVSFGMGVLVTYGYIARSCWLFLTNGKFEIVFKILFCTVTFLGALAQVEAVWNAADLANAGLLIVNLFGIAWLLPTVRRELLKTA
ncbi:MAG: amino acid carrier protein [Candidatus Babeliales bacterium]